MATTFKEISAYLTKFTLPFKYYKDSQIYIKHDLHERQTTHITLTDDGNILHIITGVGANILESVGVDYKEKNIVEILKYMLLKNETCPMGHWRLSNKHSYIEFCQTLCLMDTALSEKQLAEMLFVIFDEDTEKMFKELRFMINPEEDKRTEKEKFIDSVIKEQEQYAKGL